MKKCLGLFLVLCIIFAGVPALAQDEIKIMVNEREVECEKSPFFEGEALMVPLRSVFEAIGARVSWDDETKTAIKLTVTVK